MQKPFDELRSLIDRHCKTRRHDTALPGLTLFRAEEASPQDNTIYRPTLCIVAQGRKQVLLADRTFEYEPGQFLIVTVDLPVTGCIVEASRDRPYLSLSLDLDPARIADLLLELPSEPPRQIAPVALAVSDLGDDLLDGVVRLLRLLDRPDEAAVLRPLIDREILYRLLRGEQGALLRQVATAGSHVSQIGKVADWIRTHYAEPTTIDALAADAGMSVTSFHRHFKAITAMSPVQYRTRIRLQEARRLMLVDEQDAGAIGFGVGYESPSQFSRDYRRMFGMPPAADAARLRHSEAIAGHR